VRRPRTAIRYLVGFTCPPVPCRLMPILRPSRVSGDHPCDRSHPGEERPPSRVALEPVASGQLHGGGRGATRVRVHLRHLVGGFERSISGGEEPCRPRRAIPLSKRRCCSVPSSTRSASAGRCLGSVPAPSGAARFARRRHPTGSCAHLRRPAVTARCRRRGHAQRASGCSAAPRRSRCGLYVLYRNLIPATVLPSLHHPGLARARVHGRRR